MGFDPVRAHAKWLRNAGAAGNDYAQGVQAPRRDWATETANAEPQWQAGLQKSFASGSRKLGVQRAGTAKWQRGALEKGVTRYPQGIQAGSQAMMEAQQIGAQEQDVVDRSLAGMPKGPKASAENINRAVQQMTQRHELAMRRQGVPGGSVAPPFSPTGPTGRSAYYPPEVPQTQYPAAPVPVASTTAFRRYVPRYQELKNRGDDKK